MQQSSSTNMAAEYLDLLPDILKPSSMKVVCCRSADKSSFAIVTYYYLLNAVGDRQHCKAAELLRWTLNLYRDH